MATDDVSLRVGMGRLEIEPIKIKIIKEENPFSIPLTKRAITKPCLQNSKCSCLVQRKKISTICKKKQTKLLKEPVLRLSQCYIRNSNLKNQCQQLLIKDILQDSSLSKHNQDNLCLHSLVDNCNQLSISTEKVPSYIRVPKPNDRAKWWKNETVIERQCKEPVSDRSASGSCSQQALNPPCDVTIDELASYFETLVHIPKKMSSMAEMMYI